MEAALIARLDQLGRVYMTLPSESLEKVYRLFFEEVIYVPETDLETLYLGNYYKIKQNYAAMERVFLGGVQRESIHCQNELLRFYLKQNPDQGSAFFRGQPRTHLTCYSMLLLCPDKLSPSELAECCQLCLKNTTNWWAPYRAVNDHNREQIIRRRCYYLLKQLPNYDDILIRLAARGEDMALDLLLEYYFTRIDWTEPDSETAQTFLTYARQEKTTTCFTFLGAYYQRTKDYATAQSYLQRAIEGGCPIACLNYACLVLFQQPSDAETTQLALRCLMVLGRVDLTNAIGHLLDYYRLQKDSTEEAWWCQFILDQPHFGSERKAQANFCLGQLEFQQGRSARGLPYMQMAIQLGHPKALAWTTTWLEKEITSNWGLSTTRLAYLEFLIRNRQFPLCRIIMGNYCVASAREMKYLSQIPMAELHPHHQDQKTDHLDQYQADLYASPTYFTKWIVADVKRMIRRYLDG